MSNSYYALRKDKGWDVRKTGQDGSLASNLSEPDAQRVINELERREIETHEFFVKGWRDLRPILREKLTDAEIGAEGTWQPWALLDYALAKSEGK